MARTTRFSKALKRANRRVHHLTNTIGEAERQVVDATSDAVRSTDKYVRHNPWKAMGAAAVTFLALGTMLRRS